MAEKTPFYVPDRVPHGTETLLRRQSCGTLTHYFQYPL